MFRRGCVDPKCEKQIKNDTGVISRNRPFNLEQGPGKCVVCGKDSPGRMVWAKAY